MSKRNILDTGGDLTQQTLEDCLRAIRAEATQPLTIKPTRLIIGEEQITYFSRLWKLSRAKTLARIKRWAAL